MIWVGVYFVVWFITIVYAICKVEEEDYDERVFRAFFFATPWPVTIPLYFAVSLGEMCREKRNGSA